MSARSRIENRELTYTVRVNGRVRAAFTHHYDAIIFAKRLHQGDCELRVELSNGTSILREYEPEVAS